MKQKKKREAFFKRFQKSDNPFNFDLISRIPLKTLIMDLCLYKTGRDHDLLDNALELLFHTSCRFDAILENC